MKNTKVEAAPTLADRIAAAEAVLADLRAAQHLEETQTEREAEAERQRVELWRQNEVAKAARIRIGAAAEIEKVAAALDRSLIAYQAAANVLHATLRPDEGDKARAVDMGPWRVAERLGFVLRQHNIAISPEVDGQPLDRAEALAVGRWFPAQRKPDDAA